MNKSMSLKNLDLRHLVVPLRELDALHLVWVIFRLFAVSFGYLPYLPVFETYPSVMGR